MPTSDHQPNLDPPSPAEVRYLTSTLLSSVSRSFYLTLRILPKPLRLPVGLAYLMARTADTIADTAVIGLDQRLENLVLFRNLFGDSPNFQDIKRIQDALTQNQNLAAEQTLLGKMDRCFILLGTLSAEDRRLICELIPILVSGMEKDLKRFSSGKDAELRSLKTADELDEYTYLVAGCVGPFWTRLAHAHLKSLSDWDVERKCTLGICFGKALQLTNILRDIPRDLEAGRCYLPDSELALAGLTPDDLLNPANAIRVRPVYDHWLDTALDHYLAAWEYTMSIPKREFRLRLACIWPIWIGLKTIALLRSSENFLNPYYVIKISRNEVYALMAESILKIGSDRLLTGRFLKLLNRAK